MPQVTISIPTTTCAVCVATAGIKAFIDQNTGKVTLDAALLPALATWTTVPPPAHNHPPADNSAAGLAWDCWLETRARLLSIPPAPVDPAQDTYAALRERLTAKLAADEQAAQTLGPPQ